MFNVLIVEDNDALRESLARFLAQHGFNVTALACAEDVDDEVAAQTADLYVLDLNLPGEDGLSLAVRLRGARPYAGIIMTTARVQLSDRLSGYEHGADIYLAKPVIPEELIAILNTLGRRIGSRRNLDDRPCLNLSTGVLRVKNNQIKLSQSEVKLLAAFRGASNKTLERWQIASLLSGGEATLSVDSMQNRLSQLRKKLQACGILGGTIEPIRSLGYKLMVDILID
jgi:DNA-binding response OmpR family regulator